MGISRRLPDSDAKRQTALRTAKSKKDNTPPAEVPLMANTISRLDTQQPIFDARIQARTVALNAQSEKVNIVNEAETVVRRFISHFIQALNNAIDRALFTKQARTYYQLGIDDDAVPSLDNQSELLLWGQRLITGEANRTAAGGLPVLFPNISEVSAVYTNFKTQHTELSTLKDNYDNAQKTVEDLREPADALVLRIWNEVETAYDNETPPSKRRKAKQWGVSYVSDKQTAVKGTVIRGQNNQPSKDATVSIQLQGSPLPPFTATTNKDGNYEHIFEEEVIADADDPLIVVMSAAKGNQTAPPVTVSIPLEKTVTQDFSIN